MPVTSELLDDIRRNLSERLKVLPFDSRIARSGRPNEESALTFFAELKEAWTTYSATNDLLTLRRCYILSRYLFDCLHDTFSFLGADATSSIEADFSEYVTFILGEEENHLKLVQSHEDGLSHKRYFLGIKNHLSLLKGKDGAEFVLHQKLMHEAPFPPRHRRGDSARPIKIIPPIASLTPNEAAQIILLEKAYKFSIEKLLFIAVEWTEERGQSNQSIREHFALASKLSDLIWEFEQINFEASTDISKLLTDEFSKFRADFNMFFFEPVRNCLEKTAKSRIGDRTEPHEVSLPMSFVQDSIEGIWDLHLIASRHLKAVEDLKKRFFPTYKRQEALSSVWEKTILEAITEDSNPKSHLPSKYRLTRLPQDIRDRELIRSFIDLLGDIGSSADLATKQNRTFDQALKVAKLLIDNNFLLAQKTFIEEMLFRTAFEETTPKQHINIRFAICGLVATAAASEINSIDDRWQSESIRLSAIAGKRDPKQGIIAQQAWSLAALCYSIDFIGSPPNFKHCEILNETLTRCKSHLEDELARKYFLQATIDYISDFLPKRFFERNMIKLFLISHHFKIGDLLHAENNPVIKFISTAKSRLTNA